MTEEQMVRINEMRKGKEYFDIVAAKEVNGTALEPALTTSPFIHICLSLVGEMVIGRVII